MEQHIFDIAIDYRVHHWKGIAIHQVAEVNLQQNFALTYKIVFFKHFRKFKIINHFYNQNTFANKYSVYFFRDVLYIFYFVPHIPHFSKLDSFSLSSTYISE